MTTIIKKFPIRLTVAVFFILVSLCMLWFIIHEAIIEKEQDIDSAVISTLTAYINPRLTRFMELITFLASKYFLICGYLVLMGWFLFHHKRRIVVLSVAVTGIVGFLLVSVLKNLFQRNRPLHPLIEQLPDYSFPSGHTTSGFIFYGLLIYLVWQGRLPTIYKCIVSFFLLLISLLIGISRIYLGMHYPSDVLAGFCLGSAWLVITLLVLHNLQMSTPAYKVKI